jgi:hypothetical protein
MQLGFANFAAIQRPTAEAMETRAIRLRAHSGDYLQSVCLRNWPVDGEQIRAVFQPRLDFLAINFSALVNKKWIGFCPEISDGKPKKSIIFYVKFIKF